MEKSKSIPIFMQIVAQIKEQIKSEKLTSGMFLPNEIEFAKEFGVTRSTLRKSLDVLEREGFIERRRSKGTMIAPKARFNKHLHADLAIVTRLDLTNPQNYIDLINNGSELGTTIVAAIKRGLLIRFVPWCGDVSFFDLDEILFRKGIDGFIFTAPLYLTDFIDRVREEKIPFVLQETHYNKRGVNSVVSDDYAAIRECVRKLYELGHRKIGFYGGPLKVAELCASSRRCYNAFFKVCKEFGLVLQDNWIHTFGEDDWENRHRDAIQKISCNSMLGTSARPTAVVTATIRNAIAVTNACRELSLKIPDELSLISVGCDDSEFYTTKCTGFMKDYKKVGEATLASLMQWIGNPLYRPKCKKIMSTFVDHGTIAPVSIENYKNIQ